MSSHLGLTVLAVALSGCLNLQALKKREAIQLGAACTASEQCASGASCVRGACSTDGCRENPDCDPGRLCSADGACVLGAVEPTAFAIDTVRGNRPDGLVTTDGVVVVTGSGLDQVTVASLIDGALSIGDLAIGSASASTLVLTLPAHVATTALSLPSVRLRLSSESSGSLTRELIVLRGETGPTGPPGPSGPPGDMVALGALHRLMFTPLDFYPGAPGDRWSTTTFGDEYIRRGATTESTIMQAPVALPDGASISDVTCWLEDTAAGDEWKIQVQLVAVYRASAQEMTTCGSIDTQAGGGTPSMSITATFPCAKADYRVAALNASTKYYLRLRTTNLAGADTATATGPAPNPNTLDFRSCTITYATGAPAP